MRKKVISTVLLCTMCMYTIPVFAYTKDETVYSKMNNKGEKYQTIVSTQIENNEKLDIINDITNLINIENTNGEEEFTQEGNSLVWKANQKDIYYQGESQKELPIECNIKYELNGKEVKAEEIVGKTGHVKVKIQYINKEEHTVNINGQEQKMYTPFVAVAGTILKNDMNKNIEISNGKVINDGSKTFVLGIALPGLQESLNIDKADIDIPNNIEITMDATDFELGNIVTFVTPKVLEENDLSFLAQLDEIYNKVDTLEAASEQIQEGSTALAEGTNKLASGAKELKDGTNVAYNGAKQIKNEVTKAANQLNNDNTETLDDNTLKAIGEQAKRAANLSDAQKAQIGSGAQATAIQTIQGQKAAIGQKAANKVANLTLSPEQTNKIRADVKAGLEAQDSYKNITDVNQKALVLKIAQDSAIAVAEQTAKETAMKVASSTAQQTAEEVAGSVANTTAQTVATTTAIQAAEVTATTTAKEVANQVKKTAQSQVASQMKTLGDGLEQLTSGLGSLSDGTNSLQSGANELNKGANTLADGVKTFNEDGIKKICDYLNGDLKDINTRIAKLTELSEKYNTFTMLNGEDNGSVKFVLIMDALKKQEVNDSSKEQAILPTNDSKVEKGKE